MKFRKSYFAALGVSLAVFVGAGILALILALSIPSSPWAQQWKFLADNHFSPPALYSEKYLRLAPAVAALDFWITLPIMAIAGIAFGFKLATKASLLETIGYSILSTLILAALVLGLDWYITYTSQRTALDAAGYAHETAFDTRYVILASANILLWVVLYTAGAIAGYMTRQRLAPPKGPTKDQKSTRRRVASTIP